MSDTPESGGKPEDKSPEPEVLGPERNEPGERPRKEPRIIEGSAEPMDEPSAAGAGPQTDSSVKADSEKEAVKPETSSPASADATTGKGAGATQTAAPKETATGSGIKSGSASKTPLILALGVIALIGVAAAFYVYDKSAQTEAALQAAQSRLADLEKTDTVQATAMQATAEKLDAELGRAESAGAMLARLKTLDADTAALKESLAQNQTKLDEVAAAMPPAGIAAQVDKLETMLGALSVAIDGLGPKVRAMEARIAELEARKNDPDAAGRAALGLALANLARTAESAAPFKRELDAIAIYLPAQKELAALSDASGKGVPTRESLKARFPDLAQAVLDAERRGSDRGFWAGLVANMRALVTIRRTGEISGSDTEAVLARMEERLKRNDLAAAVTEALMLKGPAAKAASGWVADAQARVDTDMLLRDLSAHIAERLAVSAGEAPPAAAGTKAMPGVKE